MAFFPFVKPIFTRAHASSEAGRMILTGTIFTTIPRLALFFHNVNKSFIN